MKKILCIYHGNCMDGFTAAWVVRRALGAEHVEFHAGVYQDPPPDVSEYDDVILVDFSYKRAVLLELRAKAKGLVTILDHHKTAKDDLRGLEGEGILAVFDMERSGARLAWDFFFPGERPPKMLLHVEDRDLWRFALPQSREINASLFSYEYDFEMWDKLMFALPGAHALDGEAIERKQRKDVAELVKVVTRPMKIGGHVVPVANLPYTLTSDAATLLCKSGVNGTPWDEQSVGQPFAGCYWDTPKGRVFSLRSREDGLDVGEIAKQYGGGGHPHASGFRVPFDQLAQFEP